MPPAVPAAPTVAAPRLRRFGMVNWVGFSALYRRELLRVLKYYPDSVLGPTAMSLLYLLIFNFGLGGQGLATREPVTSVDRLADPRWEPDEPARLEGLRATVAGPVY